MDESGSAGNGSGVEQRSRGGSSSFRFAEDVPDDFMLGRTVALRPIIPDDHRTLYAIAVSDEINFRWRYRGAIPPYDLFIAGLHADVLAQFVICSRKNPQPIGLVVAYHADINSGICFLGAIVHPSGRRGGNGVEASALFGRYLFRTWSLRKIYMEVPEYNMSPISSAEGSLFEIEGRMRDRYYYDGQYWDNLILTIDRKSGLTFADRILKSSVSEGVHR